MTPPAPEDSELNPYAPPRPGQKTPKRFRKIKVRKLTEADRAELSRGKARKAIREAEQIVQLGLSTFAASWLLDGLFRILDIFSARNLVDVGIVIAPFAFAATYIFLASITKRDPYACVSAATFLLLVSILMPGESVFSSLDGLLRLLGLAGCFGGIVLFTKQR